MTTVLISANTYNINDVALLFDKFVDAKDRADSRRKRYLVIKLRIVGIDRMVTIIDPLTGKEEKKAHL